MADREKADGKLEPTNYPEPLVVSPSSDHKHTFIVLHGRGSNAAEFWPGLLSTRIDSSQTFQAAFPHAKFIFPTASKRRAMAYNRATINQWFDNGPLGAPTEREELQIVGLRETSTYLHVLLRKEIEQVGADNVVLGGLSQGCAASLIALLTWDGDPLAAAFGLCGWLPFRMTMEETAHLEGNDGLGEEDFFARSYQREKLDPPSQAIDFLREELELSALQSTMAFQGTPLFLGHGTDDEKVYVHLGREAASCLESIGMQVRYKEYERLGHWYSPAMLSDLVMFLQKATHRATRKDRNAGL